MMTEAEIAAMLDAVGLDRLMPKTAPRGRNFERPGERRKRGATRLVREAMRPPPPCMTVHKGPHPKRKKRRPSLGDAFRHQRVDGMAHSRAYKSVNDSIGLKNIV